MNTLKVIMAIILIITEVPAAIFLVYQWIKAKHDYNGRDDPIGK